MTPTLFEPIFADVAALHRAQREILQVVLTGVDDLMRDGAPARRAGGDVVLVQRVFLVAEAQQALPFQNEEHLLVHMMVVEGADLLAGRTDRQIVAELLRADPLGDQPELASKWTVFIGDDLQLVEIDHRLLHGSLPSARRASGSLLSCGWPLRAPDTG
jgi:hypothetical protein